MNKNWLKVGGIILGIGALGWYGYQQYKLTDKLCFNVTGYRIVSIGVQGARIDLTLSVRNLDRFAIKIKKFKFNFYAEEKFVATIYSDQVLDIRPNDTSSTTVQILLNPKHLISNVGSILQSSANVGFKNMLIKIDGGMFLSKAGIPFYVPIIYSFRLSEYIENEETEGIC